MGKVVRSILALILVIGMTVGGSHSVRAQDGDAGDAGDNAPSINLDFDLDLQEGTFFEPVDPEQNYAVNHLNHLFGDGWENVLRRDTPTGEGNAPTLLSAIFKIFNQVILAVVALMTAVTFTIGALETAHHGQTMGKRYSTLWTPLRSVGSIAMIVPIPGTGGFSLIQVLLLMFTWYSIGFGDTMWQYSLQYIGNNAGTFSNAPAGTLDDQFGGKLLKNHMWANGFVRLNSNIESYQVEQGDFEAMQNQDVAAGESGQEAGAIPLEFTFEYKEEPQSTGFYGNIGQTSRWQEDALATIWVPCHEPGASICQTRVEKTQQLSRSIANRAAKYVHYGLKNANTSGSGAGGGGSGGGSGDSGDQPDMDQTVAIHKQVNNFNQEIHTATIEAFAGQQPPFDKVAQEYEEFISVAQRKGWASAGSYYWTLSNINDRVLNMAQMSPSIQKAQTEKVQNSIGNDMARSFEFAAAEIKQKREELNQRRAADPYNNSDSWFGYVIWAINKVLPFDSVTHSYQESLTSKGDPIAELKTYGDTIINMGWGLWGVRITTLGSADYISDTSEGIVGQVGNLASGGLSGWISSTAEVALEDVSLILGFLMFPLFLLGMTLSYYIPMVPYIYWTLGYISWLIIVIEVLLAVPLWMAAVNRPEGEGIIGQQGQQGLMIALNALMRPALMVVGFFSAILIFETVAPFIGETLEIARAGMSSESASIRGPLSMIAMMTILTSLIVAVEHKCFELIEWFPDNILRFIGQNVQTLGGQDKEGEINTMVAGSFGRAESAGGNVVSGKMSGPEEDQQERPQDPIQQGQSNASGGEGGSSGGSQDAQSMSESQNTSGGDDNY